jgi:hypothetical protein
MPSSPVAAGATSAKRLRKSQPCDGRYEAVGIGRGRGCRTRELPRWRHSPTTHRDTWQTFARYMPVRRPRRSRQTRRPSGAAAWQPKELLAPQEDHDCLARRETVASGAKQQRHFPRHIHREANSDEPAKRRLRRCRQPQGPTWTAAWQEMAPEKPLAYHAGPEMDTRRRNSP